MAKAKSVKSKSSAKGKSKKAAPGGSYSKDAQQLVKAAKQSINEASKIVTQNYNSAVKELKALAKRVETTAKANPWAAAAAAAVGIGMLANKGKSKKSS